MLLMNSQKIEDRFDIDEDLSLISKKFWSHNKAISNSTRIQNLFTWVMFMNAIFWINQNHLTNTSMTSFQMLLPMI